MESQLNYNFEKKKYLDNLKNLEYLFNLGAKLSNKILEEVPRTSKRKFEEGTFLFSKILLHLKAVLNLLPESSFSNEYGGLQFWDISSIAVLTRALIESYLSFYYISVDNISKKERELRLEVWDYYGSKKVVDSLKIINPQNPVIKKMEEENSNKWDTLKDKLDKYYRDKVSTERELQKRVKQIKKANTFLLNNRAEILNKSGISINYQKIVYRYLSQFVHSTSIAIESMKYKPDQAELVTIFNVLIGHNIIFVTYAIRDFVITFPNLQSFLNIEFKNIQESVKEILKGFES